MAPHWITRILIGITLLLALVVARVLTPGGFAVSSVFAIPVIIASLCLPPRGVVITAALSVGLYLFMVILDGVPLSVLSYAIVGLLVVGFVAVLLSQQRQLTIERAQEAEEARHEAENARSRGDLLLALTEAGLAARDLDGLLESVLEQTVRIFDARAGSVLLRDESGEWLVVRKAIGPARAEEDGFSIRVGEGVVGQVAAEGRPLAVRDVQQNERVQNPYLKAQGIRSIFAEPLVYQGATLGVLQIDFQDERDLTADSERLLRAVADRVALLVANAQLREVSERRSEQLSDIIQTIAHDIRQPITTVRGQSQILRRALERGSSDRAMSSAGAIEAATGRLDAMVRDLVESARLESGQVRLECEPFDLSAFARDLASRMDGALDGRRVRVETEEPVVIDADPHRLERILGNLISNALKYSPVHTEVTVRIEQRDGEVLLAVMDRGPGIAPEDLPRLFDRGFRTADASRKAEGLGLGLYITRRLVEVHGGRVWVESAPGEGSTFQVVLPVACPER